MGHKVELIYRYSPANLFPVPFTTSLRGREFHVGEGTATRWTLFRCGLQEETRIVSKPGICRLNSDQRHF